MIPKVNILLVDDDQVDVRAIRRTFERQGLANRLVTAKDGREALEVLRQEHPEKSVCWPFLILLDLNMPRMNGLEFLQELREDTCLSSSVVFVLTTSNDERDKCAAYSRNIAGYLLKPKIEEQLVEQAHLIKQYLKSVEFPPLTSH